MKKKKKAKRKKRIIRLNIFLIYNLFYFVLILFLRRSVLVFIMYILYYAKISSLIIYLLFNSFYLRYIFQMFLFKKESENSSTFFRYFFNTCFNFESTFNNFI